MTSELNSQKVLKREVGITGAVMMGLGSIVGTGVFVSIGISVGITGPSVILAIVVAAFVATFNGLSSAQLAANHPVSGGTYEYGYRWLTPSLGFAAGWMFLCAKSASAATAALGLSGYLLNLIGQNSQRWHIMIAFIVVIILTGLVLSGIRRSSRTNTLIVSFTLFSLFGFVLFTGPTALANRSLYLTPFFSPIENKSSLSCFLQACALMFVAFTGYGRIATLGEEVVNPRTTIPRAIIVTLLVSSLLYVLVAYSGVAAVGADQLSDLTSQTSAPLETVARQVGPSWMAGIVAAGAITAMLAVILNLILGLSRVVLAMGRRGDLFKRFGDLNTTGQTPYFAVLAVGVVIACLTLIGNVKTTWSFSAFTVLIYYSLTNLAAIRLSESERLYPRIIPWLGLISCLLLAFWVDPLVWGTGLLLLFSGLVYHWLVWYVIQRKSITNHQPRDNPDSKG